MRVEFEISDKDLEDLRRFSSSADAGSAVEKALLDWLRIKRQLGALDSLSGIGWDGDLEEMRNNWSATAAE